MKNLKTEFIYTALRAQEIFLKLVKLLLSNNSSKHFILIFLSLGFVTKAQNLVPNPYFESYSVCPNSSGQIYYSTGWYQASLTPDYYNGCPNINSGNGINVPYTSVGYQNDCCGGNGFAGVFVMTPDGQGSLDGREYIGIMLSDTLLQGHKYLGSMVVNRAHFNYSAASIGMLFTDTIISLTYPQCNIFTVPQIQNTTILSDTSAWVAVQDTFLANGTELYLTIGNFSPTSLSDTVKSAGNWSQVGSAYYFLDSISVIDVTDVGIALTTVSSSPFIIYPNPNSGEMIFEHSMREGVVLCISDINGILVGTYSLSAKETSIEIANDKLENGIYLYRVTGMGGFSKAGKIVIIK